MSPACYTCKHCKRKGHLAKDCPELGERQAGTFERDNSPADLLLLEEEGEEEGAKGFNDIRMIFEDDEEEEKDGDEGEHSKLEDPRIENNPDVQRYNITMLCLLSYIYCYSQYWPYRM